MCNYIRKETYDVEAVLELTVPSTVPNKESKVDWDGDLIKMNSQRYELFKHKGVVCVECGMKGTYFAKERNPQCPTYHFNLYGVNAKGEEVMMTKDHIIPRSKGGANHFSNYQPMCADCNQAKGSELKISC